MKITFDNLSNPRDMIYMDGIPNILTIESDTPSGRYSQLTLSIQDIEDKSYSLQINNLTRDFKATDKYDLACQIVKTFNQLVDYDVYQEIVDGIMQPTVIFKAKNIGNYDITYETDIPSTKTVINGSTTDEFIGKTIQVDLYQLDTFIVSLEKTYYKDLVQFNLSGVLSTISDYESPTNFKLVISSNGQSIGYLDDMYIVKGWGHIIDFTQITLAQPVYKSWIAEPSIPIQLYGKESTYIVTINYLNTSGQIIRQNLYGVTLNIKDTIVLEDTYFKRADKIQIICPNQTIEYKVINGFTNHRLYFSNSLGGTSFFDFIGDYSEQRKPNNTTYTKDSYDYYTSNLRGNTIIYDKDTEVTHTLKTHLIDDLNLINELVESKNVQVDDERVIITNMNIEETDTDVYEVTITY